MPTHSSVLAWEIPWTEEPGGLQSMGSQSRTRLSDSTATSFQLCEPVPFIAPSPSVYTEGSFSLVPFSGEP